MKGLLQVLQYLLFLSIFSSITGVLAAKPSSFCKCTCFSNSTIIELRPINTDKDLSDGLLKRRTTELTNLWGWDHKTAEIDAREEQKDDKNKQTPGRGRALTCSDCNRAFCLDYNLPKCKGAREEDVIATCFQRDSRKDEAVVIIFILATSGLLAWAVLRPWVQGWVEPVRHVTALYIAGYTNKLKQSGKMAVVSGCHLPPISPWFACPENDFYCTSHPIRSGKNCSSVKRIMVSTPQTRPISNDDAFPSLQLFLLGICRVAEPIALTSIFPYSWVMVQEFHVGNPNDASFYAGILIAAFSLAEALTGMFWGALSDRIGRKPVLLLGCAGTMLSLLIVGFASSFWVALLGRIIGGVLNGNIGVIQTMVGELVKRPEHEPRAYAVMPFVWSIGTILGPAVGGLLAKPVEGFPSIFSPNGLFAKYPFLLPNLFCAGLLLISIIGGALLLQETHPEFQPRYSDSEHRVNRETPLMATAGATANPGVDLRAESYGTFNEVNMHSNESWRNDGERSKERSSSPQTEVAFTSQVLMFIIALGIFTYHSMTFDHLLPIFLQDKRDVGFSHSFPRISGGLGLSTRTVGFIMSVDGLMALFIQSVIFAPLTDWLGVWRLFVLVTALHPMTYFIIPFLVLLPSNFVYAGIYTCLAIRNILSIIAYPILLILIKQSSSSPSVMGKINGLAASAGAACRTIAPPVAGYLYSTGTAAGCTAIAWWSSTLIALIGTSQLWFIKRRKDTVTVRSAAPCLAAAGPPASDTHPREVIHVMVSEEDYDVA
ncbi:MFS transporter, putative [Talaromyces stipitatus ATCC 10500]|uniref:MFS transporter, putative n=1 Tax=Talaromyces stipitatus (strain ATCC 10500 / CBS 375.48 / QM 6759 / NRRL 1006) TaxID=441959 RepID=B8MC42_TALSN|nr:MFS transporter, putative [Talaromyces stipitatus ATCC 10500]EED18488.1 MFS transporter, putative [Talaromyces stipitatus ATCC 10500]